MTRVTDRHAFKFGGIYFPFRGGRVNYAAPSDSFQNIDDLINNRAQIGVVVPVARVDLDDAQLGGVLPGRLAAELEARRQHGRALRLLRPLRDQAEERERTGRDRQPRRAAGPELQLRAAASARQHLRRRQGAEPRTADRVRLQRRRRGASHHQRRLGDDVPAVRHPELRAEHRQRAAAAQPDLQRAGSGRARPRLADLQQRRRRARCWPPAGRRLSACSSIRICRRRRRWSTRWVSSARSATRACSRCPTSARAATTSRCIAPTTSPTGSPGCGRIPASIKPATTTTRRAPTTIRCRCRSASGRCATSPTT